VNKNYKNKRDFVALFCIFEKTTKMHTIHLKINEKVYEKFLWLLTKFSREEVEIITDDQEFISTKEFLQKELDEIKSNNAHFYSQTEFEDKLGRVIERYEDRL